MDRLTPEQRKWTMSRVKGKDTKIEVKVRQYLFAKGLRFRKNDNRYPGKPDVVLPKYRTVIFVNGCFWHQHEGCKRSKLPATNTDYWKKKLSRNVINDKMNCEKLRQMGWSVITLWECELNKCFDETMGGVVSRLMKPQDLKVDK